MKACRKRSEDDVLECVLETGHRGRHKMRLLGQTVAEPSEVRRAVSEHVATVVKPVHGGVEAIRVAGQVGELLWPLSREQRARVLKVVTELLEES